MLVSPCRSLAARSLARCLCTASDGVNWQLHYRRASRMYRYAPVNAEGRYHSRVKVGQGTAQVTAPAKAEYCHAAFALHGSSYFKLLDDAAFFAAQSVNHEHFVVTTSFTTYITKPVDPQTTPYLIATGSVTSASKSLILAEAVVKQPDGVEVGRGSGTFMPHPKFKLDKLPLYFDDEKYPFTDEDQVLQ